MIEAKLYCIVAKYTEDDESFTFHTVGVDMDEKTAQLLASDYIDLPVDDIEVLEYFSVTVNGFSIDVTECQHLDFSDNLTGGVCNDCGKELIV